MKVVLSIKPEFAFKIFEGTKKFEFRKSIFKNENIKTIIVYASSPVQQVIGEFDFDEVLN
jgi:predicted transcriptional regulator